MRLILLALTLMLAPFAANLAADENLYTGEAPVSDQGDAERRRALPVALEQVLQKISGLRAFDEHPLVEPALRRAPGIMMSYHYRNVENLLGDGGVLVETRLVARFSEQEVDQLARLLELPLWRPQRIPVEIWLLIDDGAKRQVLPLEYEYVRGTLDDIAVQRGLVIRWPETDDEGNYPVDLQLIWGGYTDEIIAEDGRGTLILAARREGLEWSVRSNLSYGEEQQAWRLQGIELETVLAESLHQAIDSIAVANTIAASDLGASQYRITVRGLRSSRDYQDLLGYLAGLGTVSRVAVAAAGSNRVVFDLELSALPQHLEEAIARGSMLQAGEEQGEYILLHGAGDGS